MGDLRPLRPFTHQHYQRTRRWAGGVVKDAVCPICVEHARKLALHLRASRLRGRIRRRGIVKEYER